MIGMWIFVLGPPYQSITDRVIRQSGNSLAAILEAGSPKSRSWFLVEAPREFLDYFLASGDSSGHSFTWNSTTPIVDRLI